MIGIAPNTSHIWGRRCAITIVLTGLVISGIVLAAYISSSVPDEPAHGEYQAAGADPEDMFSEETDEQFEAERVSDEDLPWGDRGGWEQLFDYAFQDPLVEGFLLYPPIQSAEQLAQRNESIWMAVKDFETAYGRLELHSANALEGELVHAALKVNFTLGDRIYEAFAFGTPHEECPSDRLGILIIPGSGHNQSTLKVNGENSNYSSLLEATSLVGKNFVSVKPNEDFLAWHDGESKISWNFIFPWHLNRAGSYSVSYLVHSLALAKYISKCHDEIAIIGLSQGGAATLLISLQVNPDFAVVASGVSVVNNTMYYSSFNQILGIEQHGQLQDPLIIREAVQNSPTRFLFSYGQNEVATYRVEVEERRTCTALAGLPNVDCIVHPWGHSFPVDAISTFLESR